MHSPTVSIIIPNYNHGVYLGERITSILNQTFQDFELIILDDRSTDNSRDIIEGYRGHPRITQIIYNPVNSGSPFKQWQKGIELAKGDYIWIAESDDWCEPTLLQSLIEPLQAHESCVISYCQSHCVDEHRNIQYSGSYPKMEDIVDGHEFIKKHLVKGCTIFNASMAIWRKKCYSDIPKDFLTYNFCGDWIFWIRLASKGKIAVNGRVLNYFRKHGQDVSSRAYRTGLFYIEGMRILNTLRNEHLISDKEYIGGFKARYKDYWLKRHKIEKTAKAAINKALKIPSSFYVDSLKIHMSAWWHGLKQ